jgi:hypothetical protein
LIDVHGGFQAFSGHIVDADDRFDPQIRRREVSGLARSNVLMGGAILGTFASHVFEVFGMTTDRIVDLTSSLSDPAQRA